MLGQTCGAPLEMLPPGVGELDKKQHTSRVLQAPQDQDANVSNHSATLAAAVHHQSSVLE